MRSSIRCVSSSEAPKNAAAHPMPASRIAVQSRGASGSCAVLADSRAPALDTDDQGADATVGAGFAAHRPAARADSFMTIAVVGSRLAGQPSTSGGAAAISIMLVNRPWDAAGRE